MSADGCTGDADTTAQTPFFFPGPARPVCNFTYPSSQSDHCTAPTCDTVAELCHELGVAGKLTRMYCPVKCGCNNPNSLLVRTGTDSGCAPSCRERFWASVAKRPCVDEVRGSAGLKVYADSLTVAAVAQESQPLGRAAENIRSWGCGGALMGLDACGSQALGEDLPFGIKGFKSIKHLCPVTCGCKGGEHGCPASCP